MPRKKATKVASKPPRILDRAAQIGVSFPTLNSWKRCGVDIWNDDEVRARIVRMRNIPPTLKPEWHPKAASIEMPADGDPTTVDIEAIIRQIHSANDKHSAQTVKTQIDALVNAYKLREAAGKYIPKTVVEEALLKIGAAVKSAVLRMEADLPPMLEGMDPATMQRTIREKVDEVMTTLSDATADIWKDDETSPRPA